MAARKGWCFTLNNPTFNDEPGEWMEDCTYIIFQLEIAPTTGTPHFQGYIHLKTKKRLSFVRGLNGRVRWAAAKGTALQNQTYCGKSLTKLAGPWEFGDIPSDGPAAMKKLWQETKRLAQAGDFDDIEPSMLIRYVHNLKTIRQDKLQATPIEPLPGTTGEWYVGPSGVGKSRKARTDHPDAYIKGVNKWWCGYSGQETVIMDDVDPGHSGLGHHLKLWADHYSFTAEIKGGAIFIRPKKIIVTSQYRIDQIWDDPEAVEALQRRFKVTHFPPPL